MVTLANLSSSSWSSSLQVCWHFLEYPYPTNNGLFSAGKVPRAPDQPEIPFLITPESLENIAHTRTVPKFRFSGKLDRAVCDIEKSLAGHIILESSAKPIKSIEIQLVRVETCGCAEG